MKGSKVEGGLLTDSFIDSAPNVLSLRKGAGQFFTPPDVADFIARVLCECPGKEHGPTFDPTGAGAGNLLAPYAHPYGIEIDGDYTNARYRKIIGDCQHVLDLATAVELKCQRIVANPPFGLQWTWRGEQMRSARAAWLMIQEILDYSGGGAIIVPFEDWLWIKEQGGTAPTIIVRVPDLFGPAVNVDCVIVFFARRLYDKPKQCDVPRRALLERISGLRKALEPFYYEPVADDEDFIKGFEALREEFARRAGDKADQGSFVRLQGQTLRVHLSPFDQLRLVRQHKGQVLNQLKTLNGQSIYQFAINTGDWHNLEELAKEGELVIEEKVREGYEKVVGETQLLMAPMRKTHNEVLRVAALRDLSKITCKKSDKERGFEKGETYTISSRTMEIQEERRQERLTYRRDPKTGISVPELVSEEKVKEHKAICFTIAGEDIVVTGEPSSIKYLVDHFDLPEVKSVEELQPELYGRWLEEVRAAVERYA